jgi:hypothetical protein
VSTHPKGVEKGKRDALVEGEKQGGEYIRLAAQSIFNSSFRPLYILFVHAIVFYVDLT